MIGERAVCICRIHILSSSDSRCQIPIEVQILKTVLSLEPHNWSLSLQVLFPSGYHDDLFRRIVLKCYFLIMQFAICWAETLHLMPKSLPHLTHLKTSFFFHPQVDLSISYVWATKHSPTQAIWFFSPVSWAPYLFYAYSHLPFTRMIFPSRSTYWTFLVI